MKIKTKLLFITGFFTLAITLLSIFLYFLLQSFNLSIEKNRIANQMATGVLEKRLLLDEYLLYREERSKEQWQTKNDNLTILLESQSVKFSKDREKEIVGNLANEFKVYKKIFSQLVAVQENGKTGTEAASLKNEQETSLTAQLLIKSQEIISNINQLVTISLQDTIATQQKIVILLIGFIMASALITIATIFLLWKSIIGPITRLHEGTEIIGKGNLDYRVGVQNRDEIGQLSRSFDEMTAKLKESYAGLEKKVKERTELLAVSELRYRRLFEAAQDGILILDASSGKIIDANPFLQKLLSYSEKELVGKELWEIGIFKDIADSKKAFLELQTKEQIRYENLPLKTKDGRSVAVEFVSNVYTVGTQKVIQCNIHDITDRKKVEEVIKMKAEELENARIAVQNVLEDLKVEKSEVEIERAKKEAMLFSIGDGLISADEKGCITLINKSAEKLLNLKNEDIMGKYLSEAIRIEDEKGIPIPLQKHPVNMALSKGTTTTTTPTYYYVRKDKIIFPVAITVTPVKLEDKIIGVIEVFRDITHETEVDKAKSEFVSLASHQLRTPLSAIKWYSKMLLNKDVGEITKKQKEYLEEIHNGNERMVSLVNALLSVSRIELGTFAVQPKKVNLVTVCKEVLEGVKEDIAHRGLNLKEEFKKVLNIEADPNYIRIIFQNLITNAIKYTPEKGTITITISENRTDLLISIKDTGYGIPEKAKKMIFSKLFRADNVVDKDPDGIGLGLYITKSIIEQAAKGKIWFESEENKGTTFYVSFPKIGMIKREGTKGLI